MSARWARLKGALGHAGLLLALAAYTAVGGLVFRALEGPAELGRLQELQQSVLAQRRTLLSRVLAAANASASTSDPPPALADLLHRQLREYEVTVQEAARGGVEVPNLTASPPSTTPPRWTLLQGMFFASTVLTTIGYGNITPVTLWGRVFCLVFALIGIPLTLSVIADLGVLLASAVSTLPCWDQCRTWWSPTPDDTGPGGSGAGRGICRNTLMAFGAVLLLFLYISAGAALFTLWEEGWDFFDGFYFCFITMTTIGFGDLVPRQPLYTLLCTLYILFGLALTSTIIELVRMQYASSWRRLQEALAESGPLFGEALRRAARAPDFDLRGALAAISLAKAAKGGGREQDPEAAQSQWEEAVSALLKEMEEASNKEKEKKEKEKEKELKRQKREKEKQRQKSKRPAKVIEIIIYETTV